ncbi:MAG: fibronectin type III domain-containing protein [Terriglobales bacterium]
MASALMGVLLLAGTAQLASAQATAAQITDGPRVEWVSDSTAVVAWTTNVPASTVLRYGTDRNNLTQTAQQEWGGKENTASQRTHRVEIKNLQANTTYFFQAESGQAQGTGTVAKANVAEFKTLTAEAAAQQAKAKSAVQITEGPKVETGGDNSAVITWTTNVAASTVVRYGTDRNNLTQTAQQQWGGQVNASGQRTHRVEIKNLQPNTTYFFAVESGQAQGSGTAAKTDVLEFRTMTTNAAAKDVQIVDGPKVEFVGDTTAVVAWSTNVPVRTGIRYGTDRNNLSQVSRPEWGGVQNPNGARTHRVELKDLRPSTPYFFVVESGRGRGRGFGGMRSQSAVTGFTTLTKEAAAEAYRQKQNVSAVKIQAGPVAQSVTDVTAALWLMTSEETAITVRYGTDRNNLTQTAQSPTSKQHSLQLTGLQPSSTYFYEVNAANGSAREMGQFQTENANFAAQKARVFLTKGPVIEYITPSNAIVAWSTNVRSSSIVRYGTDPNNLNRTAQAPWGQETHRVDIKNLRPDTKYYFVVESAQAEGTGTLAKSNSAPFTTVATGQQAMRNPQQ